MQQARKVVRWSFLNGRVTAGLAIRPGWMHAGLEAVHDSGDVGLSCG